ncbi:hypothetical protein BGZ92_011422 [Podila epicladia]|nr:hypothetical protein BGZ92_011422 [Podila epicladia]
MARTSKTTHRRNTLSILTIALVAPALLSNSFVLAQIVTGAAAYVQVRGKFYVHGGEYATPVVVTGQLLSLDLTKPWPTNAPAWKTLAPSPFVNSYHVATHSPDNKTLYFLGFNSGAGPNAPSNFLNSYSIETDTWQPGNPAVGVSIKDRRDFQGGLDPTTGKYMFLGGNYGVSGGNKSNMMNIFDTRSGIFELDIAIDVPELAFLQGNVVSWIGQGTQQGLYVLAGESSSATGAGSTMDIPFAPNPAPANRVRACVASNDDSSSLVIFGGFKSGDTGTKALGDVYIMDSKTMTWKVGAEMSDPVGYPACTIASNQLIVWGGFTTSHGIPPQANTIRVYDLGTNKWTNSYTPSTDYLISLGLLPPNKPTPSPGGTNGTDGGNNGNGNGNTPDGNSNNGSDKKSMTPIIIGAVVGAVVLIILVAGFILFKRRRNRKKPSINKTSIKVQPDYNSNMRRYTAPPPPPPQSRFKHMNFLSPTGTTTTGSSSPTLNHSRDKTEYTQSEPTISLYELSTLSPDQQAMLLAEDQANSSPGPSPTASPFKYSQAAAQRASMISSTGTPSFFPVTTTSSTTNFLQAPSHNSSNNHRHSIASSTTGTAPSLLPFLLETGSNGTGSVRYSTVSSGSGLGPPPTFASTGVQTIESVPLPPRPSLSDASMRTASTFIVAPPPQIPLPPIDDDDNDPPFEEGPAVSTAPIPAVVGGPKTDYMSLPNPVRPQSMAFGVEPTPYVTRARVETVANEYTA